jgi:HEAT repeat protein
MDLSSAEKTKYLLELFDSFKESQFNFSDENILKIEGEILWLIQNAKINDSNEIIKILSMLNDPDGISFLVLLLKSENKKIGAAACIALVKVGKPVIMAVLPQLFHQNDNVRYRTVRILEDIKDPRAIPGLIEVVNKDNDVSVRSRAMYVLSKFGSKEAIGPLIAALKDTDAGIRKNAITALGKLGAKEALPALTWLAENDTTEVHGGHGGKVCDNAKRAIEIIQNRL